jgi:rRNA-processing protein FCF1
VRHLLVSSENDALVELLRAALPSDSVLFSARGVDDTLERLARSSRVDVVVTDDPEIVAAVRDDLPGTLPVVLLPAGANPADVARAVAALDDA